MAARDDLGKWHHGQSNALECLSECGEFADGLSDGVAIRRARQHIKDNPGHFVEQSRAVFRYIDPEVRLDDHDPSELSAADYISR